ncbi:MAG: ATPase, T2SS/T4P/T4SS family [Pseudomonadota bacterium]
MTRFEALFTGATAGTDSTPTAPAPPPRYRLLFVDDEPNVLRALQRIFRQENYEIVTAPGAQEALALLAQRPCQLIISDFKMPGMHGGELLRKVKELYPDTIRIMLTGHADTTAVMAAIKDGAVYKFILKPWNDDDLRVTVALALEQYDLQHKNRELKEQNQQRAKEIQSLARLAVTNRSQLAILLHKRNLLNDQQLQALYKLQQTHKQPVIKLLLDKQWVTEKQIRDILRKELMIDEVALPEFQIDPGVAALLPRSFCERQLLLPLKQDKRRLMVAMADPMDAGVIDDLGFSLGMQIQPVMADIAAIQAKIQVVHGEEGVDFSELETLVSTVDPYEGIEIVIEDEDDVALDDLLRDSDEPPAIRLVNAIIIEAVRLGASDIHIQPRTKNIAVRYRIDGVLTDKIQIPLNLLLPLVSRIKVMAELDITERRKPQDGRLTVKTPLRIVDLRISTLPTINGEKVVMRLLDRNASIRTLRQLDFAPTELAKVENVVTKPQGIILTTGPTGSGKTTTLYSLLQHNATSEKNYVTIEDPVEYYLDMAGQVLVKDKVGLDFATVLRAILRQDPDVILLGEIRDFETAEVAFHAALTGHLVYSTLHTNSAVATIARLFDLGLKPYVIATALEAIIAQRLVRRICPDCRTEAPADADTRYRLGPLFEDPSLKIYHGAGCDKCHHSGYRGRIALYEVLIVSEEMRGLIASGAGMQEMHAMTQSLGLRTLLHDAKDKVAQGLTTPAEVLRILGSQIIE